MTPRTCPAAIPGLTVTDRPGWLSGLPSPLCPIYSGNPCPEHGPGTPEQDRAGYPEAYVSAHGSLIHPATRTLSLLAEADPDGPARTLLLRLWPFLYSAMCDAHEDVDVPAALLAEAAPHLAAWHAARVANPGPVVPNTWRERHAEDLADLLSDYLADLTDPTS